MQPKSILSDTLSACKKAFLYVMLFSCIANVLMLAVPIYSLQVLDRVLSSGSVYTLLMLSIVVGGMLLFLGAFNIVRSVVLVHVSALAGSMPFPSLYLMLR